MFEGHYFSTMRTKDSSVLCTSAHASYLPPVLGSPSSLTWCPALSYHYPDAYRTLVVQLLTCSLMCLCSFYWLHSECTSLLPSVSLETIHILSDLPKLSPLCCLSTLHAPGSLSPLTIASSSGLNSRSLEKETWVSSLSVSLQLLTLCS